MSGSLSAAPTALITGANAGVGYETARWIAAGGANVILHAPTLAAGEDAARDLVAAGVDPHCLDLVAADFTSLEQVMSMASTVVTRHRRLDLLVNNAALVAAPTRSVTVDGNEATFQVNYLAPYLLTRLLSGLLNQTPGARVINVSSTLHRTANLDWADPQRERRYGPVAAYAQSKLALTMFTAALGSGAAGFTAVSVHPGIVESGLRTLYSRSLEGAPVGEAAAVLATLGAREFGVATGAYYEQTLIAEPAHLAGNRTALARLWKLSARLTGLDQSVLVEV